MLVNLSACRVVMLFPPCMHVVCNGSGLRLCGFCCVRVWYDTVVCVDGVCSVANGLAFMVVVPDMGVLFHSWDGCGFWDIWFDLVL